MTGLPARHQGFTIIELLIVIVVIAILATISVVAYRGIQERAQNTKTIAAVRDWSQTLRMYKAEYDGYPTVWSCLGSGYGKGFSGEDSSGGECRQDSAGSGALIVDMGFMSLMSEYIKGNPTPAFVTAGSSAYPWYRGALFVAGYVGSKDRIDFVLAGSSSSCPLIAGMTDNGRVSYAATNSVRCSLSFPDSKF